MLKRDSALLLSFEFVKFFQRGFFKERFRATNSYDIDNFSYRQIIINDKIIITND